MPRKKTKKTTKTRKKPASAAKAKRPQAGLRAAVRRAAGPDIAKGLPPAPLVKLTEADTKKRLKAIMGAQCGVDPANIGDNSPIRRPNILLPRLRNAINRHFYPGLNGFLGFPESETVLDCAQRIKRTRDPQLP